MQRGCILTRPDEHAVRVMHIFQPDFFSLFFSSLSPFFFPSSGTLDYWAMMMVAEGAMPASTTAAAVTGIVAAATRVAAAVVPQVLVLMLDGST